MKHLLPGFYPTKVVLIDDNYNYLNSLQLDLDFTRASYKIFDDPLKAVGFLHKTLVYPATLTNEILQEEKPDPKQHLIDVDIRKIHRYIYNPHRFEEISIAVVDYAMPGINGLELCEKIKEKPFKRILLTGEATEKNAIDGFNRNLIHKYVRKDDPDFTTSINVAISELLYEYFTERFGLILADVSHSLVFLRDEAVINLFYKIFNKYDIVEYYLLDKYGSFLLFDRNAIPYWLLLKSPEAIHDVYLQAKKQKAPAEIVKALQDGVVIPYFDTEINFKNPVAEWIHYLHPATKISGDHDYYYALVSKRECYPLSYDNILSYERYLEVL